MPGAAAGAVKLRLACPGPAGGARSAAGPRGGDFALPAPAGDCSGRTGLGGSRFAGGGIGALLCTGDVTREGGRERDLGGSCDGWGDVLRDAGLAGRTISLGGGGSGEGRLLYGAG